MFDEYMALHVAQKQRDSVDMDKPLQRASTPRTPPKSTSRSQMSASTKQVKKTPQTEAIKGLEKTPDTVLKNDSINQKLNEIRNSMEAWPEDKKQEWGQGFSVRSKIVRTPPEEKS